MKEEGKKKGREGEKEAGRKGEKVERDGGK